MKLVSFENGDDTKEFEKQYKNHLSGFKNWDQKSHADKWMLFPENVGECLSIDEVADVVPILAKIPLAKRNTIVEVTLDMAENMEAIVRSAFPKAKLVTDRFHVQQLVSDAVQEIRIGLRRETIKEENENQF